MPKKPHLTRSAHFPFLKTMDEFDFSLQSMLRLALLGSYLGPELVFNGPMMKGPMAADSGAR